MTIAIDCRYIGKSGIGTFIENIVDCMLTQHPEHDYLLIINHSKPIKNDKCSIQTIKTSIEPFSLLELFSFPVGQINECDAFITPYINIPVGIRIPVFTTIHDMVFFDVDGLTSPIGRFVRKLYYRRAVRKSFKIFTVSNFSKDRIQHHFPTNKEIVVVYNGVSATIQKQQSNRVEKKDYFVYVGNIKKHKGLKTLVEAFCMAQKKGMTTKLLIVGNSENFRTADSAVAGIIDGNPSIEFTGWVTNEKLVQLIAEAKALIQPSLYEGFGIPPLEALYLGTNVILSDIPVFKEIYACLPVTFFEKGNSSQLSRILQGFTPMSYDKEQIRKQIDSIYSYKLAAKIILHEISSL